MNFIELTFPAEDNLPQRPAIININIIEAIMVHDDCCAIRVTTGGGYIVKETSHVIYTKLKELGCNIE